jgi:hypothetical protein
MSENPSLHAASIVLLLTATVDPGQTLLVARRDPLVRLADYQQALRYWLSEGAIRRVVFCENSSYDQTSLKLLGASYDKCDIEYISLLGNQTGATKGKGHAELEMIRHAMANSKFLTNSDIIVKCTGRLTVRNAPQLFRSISLCKFDVMCTLKKNLTFADSRLFAATPAFFRDYLLPTLTMIDDSAGVYFEHALACATARALSERHSWQPFPSFPLIEGISGTDGKVKTNSLLIGATKTLYHRLRKCVYQH